MSRKYAKHLTPEMRVQIESLAMNPDLHQQATRGTMPEYVWQKDCRVFDEILKTTQ